MITLEEYLRDPCGTLSIPYWKWKRMKVPERMRILHRRNYAPMEGYVDEPYFRLRHDLRHITALPLAGYEIRTATEDDIPTIVEIIHASYPDIRVSEARIKALTKTSVYAPELWLIAEAGGRAAGCAIADLDAEAGEGILEWVQVLPGYRRQGIGRGMVTEALRRMEGKANFATVSGQCRNETCPEALYRSCGFTGEDMWYILKMV